MKILLDESLPVSLRHEFIGYNVTTVTAQGWAGKKNGELLRLTESHFDVFISADQNLQYQINLRRAKIAIIILAAKTSRLDDLKPLIPKVLQKLREPRLGICIIK